MRHIARSLFLPAALAVMTALSCSDDPEEDDPTPSGGEVTITSITQDAFWGDEMIITGTGFSTVKEENIVKFKNMNYLSQSCVENPIEIISATATQIKLNVPLKRASNGNPICGPHKADIEVTVKDKVAEFKDVTFSPIPVIHGFAYHYGWFDISTVTKIGDSVMINGGLLATPKGESKLWDKLSLTVGGKPVPIKFRTVGLESGWSCFLPVEDFGEINCSEDPDGWGARQLPFTFHIQGTSKSASKDLYVQYLPTPSHGCSGCPTTIYRSALEVQKWRIKGKHMYVTEVEFSPVSCEGPAQSKQLNKSTFDDEFEFEIPLSILADFCQYGVTLVSPCGERYYLGGLTVQP
jgi:hypothetical protein